MHLNIFELSRRDSVLINFKITRVIADRVYTFDPGSPQ